MIRVCESPPCYVLGAGTVFEAVEKILRIKEGETTPDGLFTLEGTSCLGICGVAPAMMINDEAYGNLNEMKIKEILDDIMEKEGVKDAE